MLENCIISNYNKVTVYDFTILAYIWRLDEKKVIFGGIDVCIGVFNWPPT